MIYIFVVTRYAVFTHLDFKSESIMQDLNDRIPSPFMSGGKKLNIIKRNMSVVILIQFIVFGHKGYENLLNVCLFETSMEASFLAYTSK